MSTGMAGLYDLLPVPLQNAALSAWGIWWRGVRYGGIYRKEIPRYRANDRISLEEHEEGQVRRLREIVESAQRNVPYYRRSLKGLNAQDIRSLDNLRGLPCVLKNDIRGNEEAFLDETVPRRRLRVFQTSGTSGKPVNIYYDAYTHQSYRACYETRVKGWAGVGPGDSRAMFGVRKVVRFDRNKPPFYRYNCAERQMYFSIYHENQDNLIHYVNALNEKQPVFIAGYPSAIYPVARFLLENGRVLGYKPRAVLTSSETLQDTARECMQNAFGCKVYDAYSGVECCALAAECECQQMHVCPEVGIVEIVDGSGKPAKPGEPGEVVLTGLLNSAMPLIRYRVGDRAIWAENPCPCGRQMPVIQKIIGRVEDVVKTSDGREIVRFDTVFKGVHNLLEAQIVQEETDRFLVRVVATGDFSEKDEDTIIHNMRLHIGSRPYVAVRKVDAIERLSNGKFKAVVSLVK